MAEVGCRPAAGLHDPRLARTALGLPDGPGSLIRRTRAAAHGMARADALAAGGLPPPAPALSGTGSHVARVAAAGRHRRCALHEFRAPNRRAGRHGCRVAAASRSGALATLRDSLERVEPGGGEAAESTNATTSVLIATPT